MRIREANLNDTKVLNTFLTKLILDEAKYDKNININCNISTYYESIIGRSDICLMVAEINDIIVGYLYGYIENSGDTTNSSVAILDAIYVLDEYRNRGVATHLMDEFDTWLKTNNVGFVRVSVWNKNKSALKLYQRYNFRADMSIMIKEVN